MKTLTFKTNINCGGCIEKVSPYLNQEVNIKSWKVDTTIPTKILTIETEALTPESVILLLHEAGYKAEKI